MGLCPSCGAYPGSDHHPACSVLRGDKVSGRSAAIEYLVGEIEVYKTKTQTLIQGLYQIIDAWDGDDDSMNADPAEIARETLRKALSDEGE